MIRRREFITLLGSAAAAWPLTARAQQAKPPRIGILWPSPLSSSGHFVDAFRQGLHELGYVEGQNMTIEFRSAEGQIERLPDLAAELVHLPVDVIQTATSPTIRAAQQATHTIPIIMGKSGPCERRLRSELGPTRRKHHRPNPLFTGPRRQTATAPQ